MWTSRWPHNHIVTIPNGQYSYKVYTSYDSIDQLVTSGVSVWKDETLLADLICRPKTIRGDLEIYVLTLKGLN